MASYVGQLKNPEAVVRVKNLRRGIDGRGVLDGVDLEIRAGEFAALLGRSGSGKSTLLVTHDVDEAIERVDLGGDRTRRSPLFIDYREALLSALGVATPRSGAEVTSALGASAFRKGRLEERLERIA